LFNVWSLERGCSLESESYNINETWVQLHKWLTSLSTQNLYNEFMDIFFYMMFHFLISIKCELKLIFEFPAFNYVLSRYIIIIAITCWWTKYKWSFFGKEKKNNIYYSVAILINIICVILINLSSFLSYYILVSV